MRPTAATAGPHARVRRWAGFTVAVLLGAGSLAIAPTPVAAAPAEPASPYDFDAWRMGDPGFYQKPYGAFPNTFYYTHMMNNVGYQGPPSDPTRLPRVGEVFYMRLDTSMVSDLFADWMWYQMDLLLPDGVSPAISADFPLYCAMLKYDDVAEEYLPNRPYTNCAVTKNGLAWRFTTVQILVDESAMIWLPVTATKTLNASTVQLTSFMTLGDTTPSINPILAELEMTVGASLTPPATVPSAPRQVKVTKAKRAVKVSWAAPATNGGTPIIGYVARAYSKKAGGKKLGQCATVTKRTCTIKKLTSGKVVHVVVYAVNSVGASKPSSPRVAATPR